MEFLVQTTDNEQTLMSGAKSESVKEGILWTMQTISLDIEQNKWFLNRRYLENRIRDSFGLIGTPIHFVVRERGDKDDRK